MSNSEKIKKQVELIEELMKCLDKMNDLRKDK